jgi:hypothetical protein
VVESARDRLKAGIRGERSGSVFYWAGEIVCRDMIFKDVMGVAFRGILSGENLVMCLITFVIKILQYRLI